MLLWVKLQGLNGGVVVTESSHFVNLPLYSMGQSLRHMWAALKHRFPVLGAMPLRAVTAHLAGPDGTVELTGNMFDSPAAFVKHMARWHPMLTLHVTHVLTLPHFTPLCRFPRNCRHIPLVLLDVDGVINALSREPLPEFRAVYVHSFLTDAPMRLQISDAMVARINAWTQWAEILWMTSWREHAKLRLAPAVGLRDFAVPPWSKYEVAQGLSPQDCDRPIVWIDDHLPNPHHTCPELQTQLEQLTARLPDPTKLLTVCPTTGDGAWLTPELADRVDAFLQHHFDATAQAPPLAPD